MTAIAILFGTATVLLGWQLIRLRRRLLERDSAADVAASRLMAVAGAAPGRDLADAVDAAAETFADTEGRRRQLEEALAGAGTGVLIVSPDGTIRYANPAARRYIRARHGDAAAEEAIRTVVADVMARRLDVESEVELFTPQRRVLGLHAVPLVADGTLQGAAVYLDDLTDRRRVDAIRRDFVANAGHELKTPLGAINVLAEALASAEDAETRDRLADRLAEEAHRMARMVDDILDLSLVEASAGERLPVAVHDVIAEAVKRVTVLADATDIRIDVDAGSELVEIPGDHRQLVSAVGNLLENAIKYSGDPDDAAGSSVSIVAAADDHNVTIDVVDRGVGIPAQHVDRIFERFYRVDPARSRRTGGTGLGLAIVRHVVQNHHGTIGVDSVPNQGSRFRITLPRKLS